MKKGIGIFLLVSGVITFIVLLLSFLWIPSEEFTHKGIMSLTEGEQAQLAEVLKAEDTEVTNFGTMGCGNSSLVSFEFTSPIKASLFGEEVVEVERTELIPFSLLAILLIAPGILLLFDED